MTRTIVRVVCTAIYATAGTVTAFAGIVAMLPGVHLIYVDRILWGDLTDGAAADAAIARSNPVLADVSLQMLGLALMLAGVSALCAAWFCVRPLLPPRRPADLSPLISGNRHPGEPS